MPRNRPNESGLARVVSERPTDRSNRLTQGAVGHDDVMPDVIEDVPPVYRFRTAFDEKHEEIEVAWDEELLSATSDQRPAPGG